MLEPLSSQQSQHKWMSATTIYHTRHNMRGNTTMDHNKHNISGDNTCIHKMRDIRVFGNRNCSQHNIGGAATMDDRKYVIVYDIYYCTMHVLVVIVM